MRFLRGRLEGVIGAAGDPDRVTGLADYLTIINLHLQLAPQDKEPLIYVVHMQGRPDTSPHPLLDDRNEPPV